MEPTQEPPPATLTGTTLLDGLRDPSNKTLWKQYVDRYRPLIVRFARRVGVPEADAEDVAQSALVAFAGAYGEGRYDRDKGRLRDWLFGIVRNQVRAWRRSRRDREVQVPETQGTGVLDRAPAPDDEQVWADEWKRAALRHCLIQIRGEVQDSTWRAFELFALEGLPAAETAERLDTTPDKVFGAKRRVLRRIRELRPLMEDVL